MSQQADTIGDQVLTLHFLSESPRHKIPRPWTFAEVISLQTCKKERGKKKDRKSERGSSTSQQFWSWSWKACCLQFPLDWMNTITWNPLKAQPWRLVLRFRWKLIPQSEVRGVKLIMSDWFLFLILLTKFRASASGPIPSHKQCSSCSSSQGQRWTRHSELAEERDHAHTAFIMLCYCNCSVSLLSLLVSCCASLEN